MLVNFIKIHLGNKKIFIKYKDILVISLHEKNSKSVVRKKESTKITP